MAEDPADYLELARNFGLRVGAPLTHQSGVLVQRSQTHRAIDPLLQRGISSVVGLRGVRPASRYALICTAVEQVSEQSGIAALLRVALLSKIDWLSKLPSLAAQYGVSQVVIQRALRTVPDVVEDLRKLEQVRSVDEAGR